MSNIIYDQNQILSLFRIVITQYSIISDDRVKNLIDIAYQIINIQDFKIQSDYNLALMYVTADLIFFSENSGMISEKNIADIKVSYNIQKISSRSYFYDRYLSLLMQNGTLPIFISD